MFATACLQVNGNQDEEQTKSRPFCRGPSTTFSFQNQEQQIKLKMVQDAIKRAKLSIALYSLAYTSNWSVPYSAFVQGPVSVATAIFRPCPEINVSLCCGERDGKGTYMGVSTPPNR